MTIGVDLGTCNTVTAALGRDGTPIIVPDASDKTQEHTPTSVLLEGRKAFVGNFAESIRDIYPNKEVLRFFKRNFGTQEPVCFTDKNDAWFSETIAALVLKKVQYDAELFLPDGFNNAVITVPAHYNDIQRKSVIEAARLAGFNLSAILDEPVAAALAYGNSTRTEDDEITLVYDFGGGTFDLTLITKSNNQIHVIAKDGINKLGGREFDEIVSGSIIRSFEENVGFSFPMDVFSKNRLQTIAEKIKIELNNQEHPSELRKWIMFGRDAFEFRMHFDDYAALAQSLILKTEVAVNRCLRSLGMTLKDVNKFILIGGSSSSKLVYDFWRARLTEKQHLIYHQPFSSVAKGAALYAASLDESGGRSFVKPIDLKSVSTYNIGLQIPGERMIDLVIHRNSPLPVSARKLYRIDPAAHPVFQVTLCQFWDADAELHELGTLRVADYNVMQEFMLEVMVENRLNGTIGIKVRNADNGQDLRFEFNKKLSAHKYDFMEQKSLLDNVFVNTIPS